MKIETIKLDKGASIFPVKFRNFHCKTVADTVAALQGADLDGAYIEFCVHWAPNREKAIKTYTRRCRKIAEGLGVQLGELEDLIVDGHHFENQYKIPFVV